MKFFLLFFLGVVMLSSSCIHRPEEKASLLDSLLYVRDEDELTKMYGENHVRVMQNLHGDGQGSFALLFQGTSVQVLFEWNHVKNNITNKSLRHVKISLEHAAKSTPAGVKKWTTKAGIVPGMKLKDLEALIGEFKIKVSRTDRKRITTVYKHEPDTTTYTIFFDPELKFTRKVLKLDNFYTSKLSELQEENPVVFAVELSREFSLPVVTIDTIAEEEADSTRIEHIVSFASFYTKFIASGALKPIALPFDQGLDYEGPEANQSPEGAFHNTEHNNGNVRLIGILPDTSHYYGIVWRMRPYDPIADTADGFYNTFITTFNKQGKVIASEMTELNAVEHDPGACAVTTTTSGSINADLSFASTQAILLKECTDERGIHHEMASITGIVKADGTITITKEGRHRID